MDPDPAIFVIDLQDPNKKLIFSKKKSKKSHKTVGIKVFLFYFCLMIEGSGSRRSKNVRIRRIWIRIWIRSTAKNKENSYPDLASKTGTDPHFRTRGLGEVHADGPPPVPAGLRLTEADAQVREGVQEDRQTELHVCLGARQAEPTTTICHDSLIRVQRCSDSEGAA